MTTVAETDRLLLRHFSDKDAESLFTILSHPEVMKFSLKGPMTREQVDAWLKPRINASLAGQPVQYAVIRKTDDALLGFSGYIPFDDPEGEARVELGYRYHPSCWGKGVATEAGRATLAYGFDHLGLEAVAAIVEEANAASVRVLEKLGLRYTNDMCYHDIPVRRYVIQRPESRNRCDRM